MDKTYTRINWQNEPSVATPINDVNLNKMDYSLNEVDNRIISLDTSKADQSDLLQTVKAVTYNTTTGVFTFTFWNGTVVTADLNIEKIPVSFSMSPQGVITMTTADGTEYTADVSELIKTYSFVDSSEIDFTVTTDSSGNKSVTASIVAGSITGEKLQPNYLADCVTAKQGAESAAGSASSSATSSELSSEDSEAWAVGTRDGVPVPSTDPAYENNSKYWAEHGSSNSFAGLTDTSFTNLQNGQIAKYNSTTRKWENTEDEGGLLPHFKITSEAGSTVTVVCPDSSTITPTQTSSGIWQCDVPAYGVYTVHAVINGDDAVRTVTVDTVKEYVIHDEHYSYTLNVYAPTGSSIIVTDGGDETYTGTGAGSTAVVFALHQASTTYTIEVTYDGLEIDTTITSSATTGGSGSKTIEFGTINLTLDEDLIGETIVMTNGTATKSKVADSTSMVFYPNATGNWTISCEYEGETYYSEPNPVVVSSLSTPVSAEISLVHIPEGATVTPTDDIQTWLACANITDKSYTTLAEVLADRETFETLLRDSNACDYMARSTSWAGSNDGLVPTMTSDTTPSGECFASSLYSSSYHYYYAFDNDSSTIWYSSVADAVGSTIGYDFGTPVIIDKVRIVSSSNTANNPTNVTIQGYDTEWHDIATFSRSALDTTTKFDNSTPYTKYRVKTNTFGGTTGTNTVALSTLQFYYAGITGNESAMSLIGKYDYCSNALLGNATWASAITSSEYTFIEPLVPTMTDYTTPSGEVIYSSEFIVSGSIQRAYMAFDKNNSSTWSSDLNTYPQYIGYKFDNPTFVSRLDFTRRNLSQYSGATAQIKIQGSVNGSTDWIDLTEEVTQMECYTSNVVDTILFTKNFGFYKAYRVYYISGSNAGLNSTTAELQFYGRASSNVSNTNGIIHTAPNDTVTANGNTYVADSNGIAEIDFSDFDEGTYTFTSGIAKDPTNLSNDYSKSFEITKSPYGGTTELYLMPDAVKTLYWYGYESDNLEDCTTANGWSSSRTLSVPTHNTNNIILSGSSTTNCGIGSKNALIANIKLHCIAISTANNMSFVAVANSKSINTVSPINYISTTKAHIETSNISTSGNSTIVTNSNGTVTIDAFWYE